jgi:hypothetical protein
MLSRDEKGAPDWQEGSIEYFDQSITLTAEDRGYLQFPPEIEFPQAVTDLIEGAGVFEQDIDHRKRYHYALFADTSPGKSIKGPMFNPTQSFTYTANQKIWSVTFNNILYFASGTRLYKISSTSGAHTLVNTFAQNIGQMAVYRGTNSADLLFIPQGNSSNFYTMTTGEVLTQHASKAAIGFVVVGDELWRHTIDGSNRTAVSKSTDGGSASTWAADYTIGDGASSITQLVNYDGTLIVLKEDGIYNPTYTSANISDEELTPELKVMKKAGNGQGSIIWDNYLVMPFADSLYMYQGDTGMLSQVGPETLPENYSEVKGPVKAVAAMAGLNLYAIMYNSSNSKSYLAKYGSWQFVNGDRKFIPGWHMALYRWSKQAVHMSIHYTTVSSSKPFLYVWFADGTTQYMKPNRTINPIDDPDYEFDTANTGYIYLPRLTGGFPFETKVLKAIGISGRELASGTRQIGAMFKYAPDAVYNSVGVVFDAPGERLEITNSTPAANSFDIAVSLSTTSSSSTPVLSAVVCYLSLRTSTLKELVGSIVAEDNVTANDGSLHRGMWEDIRYNIENALTATGAITVISPSGEQLTCIGVKFGHKLEGRHPVTKALQWSIPFKMIQVRTVATRGTWERVSAYTWGEISSYTWQEIRSI